MTARAAACAVLVCLAACDEPGDAVLSNVDGDPEAGRQAIARVDCGVCHVIPGVAGARGSVGPSLEGFALRAYIAGTLPNRPSLLVDWVRNAPALVPSTAMPPLPLSSREAQDVAAFLYTLR